MNISWQIPLGFVSLLLGLVGSRATLAAPAPVVTSASSMALRQGDTLDVAIEGRALGAIASAAVMNPSGVAIELVRPDKAKPGNLHLKITAAKDAVLGDREMRLIGPTGVTRPLHVFVSQYPIVAEKEPNNTPEQAQDVSFPATIVGKIDAPGDIDQFRFNATKGQHLIFDIQAGRAGSKLDPLATIHAADGREMKGTVERIGTDPVIVFQAPQDGQYRLRLRDLEYRGGGDFDYRIIAGLIPYVQTLLPSSGEPGMTVKARAIGYNLAGGEEVTVDLTRSAPGRIEVRAKTSVGYSNPVPFEVTELPEAVESEPNDTPQTANLVAVPGEISAHLGQPSDIDYFKFHLAYKQVITLEVLAGRYGSPVTPLLQLRNAKGDVMQSNDGMPDSDARIVRDLEAGDYIASVRDLTFGGGPDYWYRLKIEPAVRATPDFSVRFLPDLLRIHRGGNLPVWCEVTRLNGFKGDVALIPEGLPPGVSAAPIVMSLDSNGWFTLAAAPDAKSGSFPIGFRASATIGNVPTSHQAQPELDGLLVQQAYLTVLEAAPFQVEAVAAMSPQRLEQLSQQIGTLSSKLAADDPKFQASLAQWATTAGDRPSWVVLNPAEVKSAKGTTTAIQPDGSILATGNFQPQEDYTLTLHTDIKAITAIRLEAMTDDRLPGKGPGAAPNGNFVLTKFKVLAAKEGQPAQAVAIKNATADFSQNDFPISSLLDSSAGSGWAIDAMEGQPHTAVFETAAPIGSGEDQTLTIVLEHQSGVAQHVLGKFRISVTTADPSKLTEQGALPPRISAILAVPAQERTGPQRAELAAYYRTIYPATIADRARIEALRAYAEPYAEIARLEPLLKGDQTELRKEEVQWQRDAAAGMGWTALAFPQMKADSGARFEREKDGSVFVEGPSPISDVYELTALVPFKQITAIRLEALPDPRLPGNGPGKAGDGDFILTRFAATSQAKGQKAQEVGFESARASFEQEKFPVAGTLDDKDDTGWAIAPAIGRPAEATYYPKKPIPGGSRLTLRLEQKHPLSRYSLGRFRIWVTANPQPDAAVRLPDGIAQALKMKNRPLEKQRELDFYFRSISLSLEPLRQRIADLRSEMPPMPLKFDKNRNGVIPVPIDRAGGFTGDVQVTLMGFAKGRGENGQPKTLEKELKLTPLTIPGQKMFGTLVFASQRGEELASRAVVLKAEAKVGNETVIEYSPAFLLTIGN